jgi:hypothetical protein
MTYYSKIKRFIKTKRFHYLRLDWYVNDLSEYRKRRSRDRIFNLSIGFENWSDRDSPHFYNNVQGTDLPF